MYSDISRTNTRNLQNEIVNLAVKHGWNEDRPLVDLLSNKFLPSTITIATLRKWVYPQYSDELRKLLPTFENWARLNKIRAEATLKVDKYTEKWASAHKQTWLDLQDKLDELDKFINDHWMELRTHKHYTIPRVEIGEGIVEGLEKMQQYTDKHLAYIDELES